MYFLDMNIPRHCASSTGTTPSKRLWSMSGGYPVDTWKWERFSVSTHGLFTPTQCFPLSTACLTCCLCRSLDRRLNSPESTGLVWKSLKRPLQNQQTYTPEKLSTKPAIPWAPRLSAATHCTVPFIFFPVCGTNTPCSSKTAKSHKRGSSTFSLYPYSLT